MKFKTVPITNFQDTIYNFYYQLIIHGIKVLLLQSDVNEEFIFKYRNNDTYFKTYGEQYESDWWYFTQKNIPPDNVSGETVWRLAKRCANFRFRIRPFRNWRN